MRIRSYAFLFDTFFGLCVWSSISGFPRRGDFPPEESLRPWLEERLVSPPLAAFVFPLRACAISFLNKLHKPCLSVARSYYCYQFNYPIRDDIRQTYMVNITQP